MRFRQLGALVVLAVVLVAGACTPTPTPGNLAIFCSLLEEGTGLTEAPTAADLEDLASVAPPDIRPTIEALQDRNRDLGDLLAERPRNLEAIFNARFDPAASTERTQLDDYAENSCALEVNRSPATRWNTWQRQNLPDAPWQPLANVQFEVSGEQISAMTLIFDQPPEPASLLEQACDAARGFLQTENADPGRVEVLVGTVRVIEVETPAAECRLP